MYPIFKILVFHCKFKRSAIMADLTAEKKGLFLSKVMFFLNANLFNDNILITFYPISVNDYHAQFRICISSHLSTVKYRRHSLSVWKKSKR